MRVVDTLDKEIGPWAAFLLVHTAPNRRDPSASSSTTPARSQSRTSKFKGPPDLLDRGAGVPFEFPADIPWPPTPVKRSLPPSALDPALEDIDLRRGQAPSRGMEPSRAPGWRPRAG